MTACKARAHGLHFAISSSIVLSAYLVLNGCGRSAQPTTAPERTVSVYNWADYIGHHTVEDFEKATGIKVDYDTFDADSTLEAKMFAGGSGYDVVSTSTNYFSRQIKAGAYQKLDRQRLPNWRHLNPKALAIFNTADPGNQYAVPYLHAINGFAYNVGMINARMAHAPVDSLDLIFKPENLKRFADCGVIFLDSAEDVFQLALNYLHLDPNTDRAEDYKAAAHLIMTVRPYIRTFDSVEYTSSLANQEACIAMSWSSDYAVAIDRAKKAGVHLDLAFTIPKEGANATYSGLLIPADAPHGAEAHAFLNYLLDPHVIAAITNDTHYGNDNASADPWVDPTIRQDPTLYPTEQIRQRLYLTNEVSAATERIRTRLWTRIKTNL
jgi:putrescine transport system substrate-binding protein